MLFLLLLIKSYRPRAKGELSGDDSEMDSNESFPRQLSKPPEGIDVPQDAGY